MKLKFLFLIYCSIQPSSPSPNPTKIECNFSISKYSFWLLGNIYRCQVKNDPQIYSPMTTQSLDIIGTHIDKNINDNVIGFHAASKSIQFFPHGIDKHLPNLKMIEIYDCNLKQILKSDLKPFAQLVRLQLDNNDIDMLEEDLFVNNSNLAFVSLDNNKIFFISADIFDNLIKLVHLSLKANNCVDMIAVNNKTAVTEIIKHVKDQCTDMDFNVISQKFNNLENDVKKFKFQSFLAFYNNLEKFEDEFKVSRFAEVLWFRERLDCLKDWKVETFWTLKSMVDAVGQKLQEFEGKSEKKFKEIEKSLESRLMARIQEVEGKIEDILNET
ncbi:unnamed protein product [Chironomus riparius]|uniref:Uncharacterized protein n=1 Tax=Chironomus riparius TaxID=315576 RepID=A0A9N9S837_9DIPT|nr:unnamed protein product [Chironomus riparius]